MERNDIMSKILFMNCSPNKDGNTYQIGEQLLKNVCRAWHITRE